MLEGPAVGALQKKREIAELTDEVARLEERYNEIITRHYELQKQMGQPEGVLKGLDKHQHAEELIARHPREGPDTRPARSCVEAARAAATRLAGGGGGSAARRSGGSQAEEEAARGEVAHRQTDREARRGAACALLSGELAGAQPARPGRSPSG